MIRKATKYDKPQIIKMMRQFQQESPIAEFKDIVNEPYWNRLLDTILAGAGIIYIEDGKGLIMALISHIAWCDKTYQMYELAYYVKPEYRNTTLGYRLLKAYVDYGKQLKAEGRIQIFSIGKMVSSPDIKYNKFGFNKLDEIWIQ